MGKTGKDGLIRRVRQFDTVNFSPDQTFTVDRILKKHNETAARIASAGCGTFYVWVCLKRVFEFLIMMYELTKQNTKALIYLLEYDVVSFALYLL